jgi:tetraacyldisaccharide 4'-kinase
VWYLALVMRLEDVRLRVAQGLEAGAWDGAAARALAHVWSAVSASRVARPLAWPAAVRVVAVGGATLGGSGKTPLAIACARELAAHARVAFIAHGYRARARAGEPRVVRPDDHVSDVGDEALVAARSLDGHVPVVVAGARQAAVDHASRFADVLVLDGVLQTSPRRASLSLLALDAESPWGTGAVPPRGDLRAPVASLVAACDHMVHLETSSAGAYAYEERRLLDWPTLRPLRLGLFVALARPQRVLGTLARHGITPAHVVALGDHALPPRDLPRRLEGLGCDLWLASAKCATRLEALGIPHATIAQEVHLSTALRDALSALGRLTRPVAG